MRLRIDHYLIGLAHLCCLTSLLLAGSAQAKAKKPPTENGPPAPCSLADNRSREMPSTCTAPNSRNAPPTQQPPQNSSTNKDPLLSGDRQQAFEADDSSGHFDAKGRIGLIPVGRMGWREIGSWREMHRVRSRGQVP